MSTATTSDAVTREIRVNVESVYLPEESAPEEGRYLFGYHVRLANEGSRTVQLLTRHWIIIDAEGEREDVKGPGVVGHQPVLGPGQSFEYRSFCPLTTPWGTMEGSYRMRQDDGEEFDAAIGRFHLAQPSERRVRS